MFVYILRSKFDGSEYVGMSARPDMRLIEHNRGHVTSTKSKRPWEKIYEEKHPDRLVARRREKYLKSAAGRKFRAKLRGCSSVG